MKVPSEKKCKILLTSLSGVLLNMKDLKPADGMFKEADECLPQERNADHYNFTGSPGAYKSHWKTVSVTNSWFTLHRLMRCERERGLRAPSPSDTLLLYNTPNTPRLCRKLGLRAHSSTRLVLSERVVCQKWIVKGKETNYTCEMCQPFVISDTEMAAPWIRIKNSSHTRKRQGRVFFFFMK